MFRTTTLLMKCYRRLHPLTKKPRAALTLGDRLTLLILGNWYKGTMARRFNGSMPPTVEVGPVLKLPHGFSGIFIIGTAKIGARVMIHQHVTIGKTRHGAPVIGDDVVIGANVTIAGRTTIGNGAKIGAGVTIVDADIEPGAIIVNASAYDVTNRRYVRPVAGQ